MEVGTIKKLTLLLIPVFLTGCTGDDDLPNQLVISIPAEQQAIFQGIIEQFKLDSGAEVVLVVDGENPQADLLFIESTKLPGLVDAGEIQPVDQSLGGDLVQAARTAFSIGESLYGVPVHLEQVALVCHRELVSSQPASWESLRDLGFNPYFTPGNAFDALLYLSSYSELSAAEAGSVSPLVLSEDVVLEFSSWITEEGENFRLIDYSAAIEDFKSKKSTCLIAGPWMAQQLLGLELISYEMPQTGEHPASSPALALGFAVSSSSENPDLAQRFLRLMATKEAQRDIYLTTGLLPATRSFVGELQNPLFRALLEKDLPSFSAPNFSEYFVELLALEQLITDSISSERDLENIYARYLQKLGEDS